MATTIYIVLHEDRHTDAKVYSFLDVGKAIDKSNELAEAAVTDQDDIEELEISDSMSADGWVYALTYSEEGGDNITVIQTELVE